MTARMTTDTLTRRCRQCGQPFTPSRTLSRGRFAFCSRPCMDAYNHDALYQPHAAARTHKMTEDEFAMYYEAERQRLIAAGLPLRDPGWRARAIGMGERKR